MRGKYVTETLRVEESGIARAAETLRAGGLVAVPTETVYGLAARADSEAAVADIYAAKGRPSFNPLIVHVASLDAAREFADFSPQAEALAQAYWPGPLTLVLPRKPEAGLAAAVTAGLDTIALRMPAHPVMRRVLEETGLPLAAPSANRSGYISPTSAAHVLASLDGRIHAVLDGGECERGLESTIAAVRGDGTIEILRPGPVELDAGKGAGGGIEAPGQLASHYAPGKPRPGRSGSAALRVSSPGCAIAQTTYRGSPDSRRRHRHRDQRPLAARGDAARSVVLGLVGDRGDDLLHFGIGVAGVIARPAIAILAIVELLLIVAFELGETFLAPPDFAAALFISLGLAGGGKIHTLADDLDRRRRDVDHCLG